MIPKRRKHHGLGLRQPPQLRSDAHLRWIRGHECSAIHGGGCDGKIEAAHVRSETDGGMGVKPSDRYTIPLCRDHHAEQHRLGEAPFEERHKINMRQIADALWARSPHRATAVARKDRMTEADYFPPGEAPKRPLRIATLSTPTGKYAIVKGE